MAQNSAQTWNKSYSHHISLLSGQRTDYVKSRIKLKSLEYANKQTSLYSDSKKTDQEKGLNARLQTAA